MKRSLPWFICQIEFPKLSILSHFVGQGEVFRRNHLIRLGESIKTKRSIVTFLKKTTDFYC